MSAGGMEMTASGHSGRGARSGLEAGRRDVGAVIRLWGRSLGPSLLVLIAAVAVMAVALVPLYIWAANAALLLGFSDADQITPRQFGWLLVAILVPLGIVVAFLAAAVAGAVTVVAGRITQGLPARPMGAFRSALRNSPRLVVVLVALLGSVAVAFVVTPFLVLFGIVALVLTPIARALQRRWARLPWPATRSLVVLAIPFGAAAALVVRWTLVLPAVALERDSIRAAFSRSIELSRSQAVRITVVAGAFFLMPMVVIGAINNRVLDGVRTDVGAQLWSTGGGLILLTLGVAAMAHLFTQLGPEADLSFVDAPPPGRARSTGVLLVLAVLAASVPVGLAFARPAVAAVSTIIVNDLGDAPDAAPGDAVCATATGTCTLRAALGEANASTDEVIGFAVDGTITVGSTLAIARPLSIDGTGHRVIVSGDGSVGVFATQIEVAGGGSATLRSITIADGYDGSTGGGAIYNSGASGGEGLVLDRVMVRDNVAATGAMFGGAVVNVSKLTVRNSTFSGNSTDATTDGSDVSTLFSGEASISQSTFTGSSGSSSISSTSGTPTAITNSIVSGPGFACSGSFTGSGNVTVDATEICPGTFGATTASLGLTSLSDNGGATPTMRLLPSSVAVDAGDATACEATDQRGATRPKGAGCDAGAYELDPTTTTVLVATPASAPVGSGITLNATVAASGEPVVPTGSVELFDGATSLGMVPLDGSGSASKVVTSLAAGSHALTAVYRPDAKLAASTSAVKTVAIERAASTVTLTSSGSPTGGGVAVTFAIAVTGAGGTPTGSVTLRNGATTVQTVALDGLGQAQVTTSTLGGGPHVMVADYAGDSSHAPASSAPLGHEVVGGTTTVLSGPAALTVFGNDAHFEVEVTADAGTRTPTGGVALVAGTSTVGLGTLDGSGSVSIPVADLPPGANSVVAVYAGDAYNGASSSAAVAHQVTAADTSTSLVVTPSPSNVYGTALTVQVAVTATGTPAVPSGVVTLYDGTTTIYGIVLGPDGTATTTLPVLPAGHHVLRAEYSGPAGFRSSTAPDVDHEIIPARSAVALTAGSAGSVTGELVSLSAAVTSSDSPRTPVGTVTFRDGAMVLGTVAADGSGVARLDTRAIAVGSRSLTASFDGGTDFAAATSAVLGHNVGPAAVQVTVQSSPTRSWFGSFVAIDVVVAAVAPGTGIPTGSVTIRDGAAVLCTPVLDGTGRATLSVSTIAVGSRTIEAAYAGDGAFRSGSGTTTHTVDPDTTTVTVLTSEPDQLYGRPVTLTAAVLGTGSAKPTGTVTFTGAGRTLGTAPLDGSGRAEITVADLPVGSTTVLASYAGDGSFTAGAGQLIQRVSASPTSTSLAVTPSAPSVTDVVTLTATVTAPGASITPSGSVGFYDNDALIGTATLDGTGKAAFAQQFDRTSHELQARFTAASSWQASASARQTIVPGRVSSALALGASPNPVAAGRSVTLVAVVPTAPGAAAPTGVIHFTDATGALGSAPLVDGSAVITVPAPLAIGSWVVSAWYPGDLAYEPIAPTGLTVAVEALPTTVTVVSTPNPGLALDGPVTLRAHVASAAGGPPIAGTVRFTSDSTVLTSQDASVDAEGIATTTVVDVPAGTWHLRAEYRPASGSPYAGSEGTVTHAAVKRAALVKIGGATGLQAGRATNVTAVVTDPAGSAYVATGTIVISDGNGATCTVTAPLGACDLVLPTAGPVTLKATYSGDGRFLGDDDAYAAIVTAATPTLRVSSSTQTWTTGDPITVAWSLTAGATGTVTVRSPFGVACTVPAASSGSCTATIPFEARGATFDFDVAYSGDATWDPAFGSVRSTLHGCYPVPFTASPPEGGTVVGTPGNCNSGVGFREGTMVTAMAAPAPGYVLSRWLETDSTVLAYRFAVGESTRSATAVFQLDCVTVTTQAGQAPGVDPAGSASGYVQLSAPGDCGVPDERNPATGVTTSRYRRGDTIQATAVASSSTTGEFKGWTVTEESGLSTQPTDTTIDVTLASDVDLAADFGARCYEPAVVTEGEGTARIGTAPNCFDAAGKGYLYGTDVAIEAEPGAFHYVGPMQTEAGATVVPTAYSVRSDDSVTVRFDPCKQLTTGVTGSGRGEVHVSTDSTCPGGEPGYYVPGEITLEAVPSPGYEGEFGLPVEGDHFKRWDADDDAPIFDRSNPLRVDMSRDRHITAVFTSPSRCATVNLKTQSPEWLGGLKVVQGSDEECDGPNQYLQGQPFTLTADALQGEPLVQWQVTGLQDFASAALSGKSTKVAERTAFRSQLPGGNASFSKMYGDLTATAYACAAITPDVSLVDANGSPLEGETPDGFVSYDREPTCPGTGNGWLVGDTVGYYAGAQPVGYTFQRWEGDVSGTEIEDEIVLDGSRAVTTLRPVYQVECFTLRVTPTANTAIGVEPNCPGADPAEGRYIGGTVVALHAFDGGEVWVGWEGDVARPEDPSWVEIEHDSTANAKWRNRTTNEKIENFFTDVGDVLAVGAKKLVGLAIIAATAALDSAFTATMGLITLAATAIDAIAGAVGSPADSGFREAMQGIQQTAALFSAPMTCGTEWAFSDARTGGNSTSLDGDGGDLKDAIKDPKKLQDKIDNYNAAVGQIDEEIAALDEGASRLTKAKLLAKKFAVKAKVAKSLGTTALTVAGIATSIASGDFGFESTADEAWGSASNRKFMDCMANALPDYWGAPPLTYDDP